MAQMKLVIRLEDEHVNWDTVQWPSLVRRNPNFSPQLYFLRVQPMGSQSDRVICSQAIADSRRENAVRTFDFLKRKFAIYDRYKPQLTTSYNRYVVDEQNNKLFIAFGKALPPLQIEANLKVFDLHFDPPDRLGYRRIMVDERPNTLFKIEMDPIASLSNLAFAIFPVDGRLLTYHTQMTRQHGAACVPAALATPKEGDTSVVARLGAESFVTTAANRDLLGHRFLFSRLNHLLVLFISSRRCEQPNTLPVCLNKSNKYAFVWAYNSEVELVHKVKIDPMDFVANISPAVSLPSSPPVSLPASPINTPCSVWRSTSSAICTMAQLSHLLYLPALHNPQQAAAWCLPSYVVGTELYVKLCKENNREELYVINLGPKLKDYRRCARCKTVEDKKRRNKDGKRISKFKVCRKCKSLNLHLLHLDADLMCHYCSDRCQWLDWNNHKLIHKRPAINREKDAAPCTYEKVM